MHLSIAIIASLLAGSAIAKPLRPSGDSLDPRQDDENHPDNKDLKICHGLQTQDSGCVRYTRGFDVTGVLTTVVLTFSDGIRDECDCIRACLDRPTTCANYVWKFTTDNTDHRTCTLYSNFNLPPGVEVEYSPTETANNFGLNPISGNPQTGGLVPQAAMPNSTEIDKDAVSGPVWQLEGGGVQC